MYPQFAPEFVSDRRSSQPLAACSGRARTLGLGQKIPNGSEVCNRWYIQVYNSLIPLTMKRLLLFTVCALLARGVCAQEPVAYFDVGDPIRFGGERFRLGWSAHPDDTFYLQEYFPKGERPESYRQMYTVSLRFCDRTPAEAVAAKIAELDARHDSGDKLCRHQVFENGDERMLDFLVSAGANGTLSVVEWDLHRYRQVEIDGRPALLLLFYSHRAYGDDILPFLRRLSEMRFERLEELGAQQLPLPVLK